MNLPKGATLRERLEKYSVYNEATKCIEWFGAVDKDGYGVTSNEGKKCMAHRAAYELNFGPVAAGLCVLHTCDNPRCISPRHLFVGDKQMNNFDRARKGRNADRRGDKHPLRKLSSSDVASILEDTRTQAEIAIEYGVSQSQVSRIKGGSVWKHIERNHDEII